MSAGQSNEPVSYGKYELLRRIGMGGMAEVFLARVAGPSGFEKQVVIKRILATRRDDAAMTEMFLDEARLAARLTHPNICQVFDLGQVDGQYYIAMEHVPGHTLQSLLKAARSRAQVVPLEATLRIAVNLLEALDYAHALADDQGRPLKLVHRDVTPSNVMVTPQGAVKLLDFGIARATTRTYKTQAGIARGKLGYMSPEQLLARDVDGRADLFAVGAILYVATTGELPYGEADHSPEGLGRMVRAEIPPPRERVADFDEQLSEVIMRALAREPAQRYPRAAAMAAALEAFASERKLPLTARSLISLSDEVQAQGLAAPAAMVTAPLAATEPDRVPEAMSTGDLVDTTATVRDHPPVPERTQSLVRPAGRRRLSRPLALAGAAVAGVALVAALSLSQVNLTAQATATSPPAPVAVSRAAPQGGLVAGPPAAAGRGVEAGLGPTPEPSAPADDRAAVAPAPATAPPAVPQVGRGPEAPGTAARPDPPANVAPKAEGHVAPPGDLKPRPPVDARPVVVARREPAPAPASSPPLSPLSGPSGLLQVRSEPVAELKVDAQAVGKTPRELTLRPGLHRVTLDYGAGQSHTVLVTIVEGRTTPVIDRR